MINAYVNKYILKVVSTNLFLKTSDTIFSLFEKTYIVVVRSKQDKSFTIAAYKVLFNTGLVSYTNLSLFKNVC